MRYRVALRERNSAEGTPSEDPAEMLATELPMSAVIDAEFIERTEPAAAHGDEAGSEDDDFLNIGSEVWEYWVPDEFAHEFEAALRRSGLVIEYDVIGEGTDSLDE